MPVLVPVPVQMQNAWYGCMTDLPCARADGCTVPVRQYAVHLSIRAEHCGEMRTMCERAQAITACSSRRPCAAHPVPLGQR